MSGESRVLDTALTRLRVAGEGRREGGDKEKGMGGSRGEEAGKGKGRRGTIARVGRKDKGKREQKQQKGGKKNRKRKNHQRFLRLLSSTLSLHHITTIIIRTYVYTYVYTYRWSIEPPECFFLTAHNGLGYSLLLHKHPARINKDMHRQRQLKANKRFFDM